MSVDPEKRRAQKRASSTKWAKANPEAFRANVRKCQLRLWYGITVEDYDRALAAQGGVCAVCRRPERAIDKRNGNPRRLSVDHCHVTKKFRGLLCGACNLAIGYFDDDTLRMRAAASYIEGSR